ncbi:unnamed protein product, partial [Prorocentrum cordatum]
VTNRIVDQPKQPLLELERPNKREQQLQTHRGRSTVMYKTTEGKVKKNKQKFGATDADIQRIGTCGKMADSLTI